LGSSGQQLLSPPARYSGLEAQGPESDLVKADCLKYLKHRSAESHYFVYDWSGGVAAVAASVKGAQTSCVSI
jgi:hypothetical protein